MNKKLSLIAILVVIVLAIAIPAFIANASWGANTITLNVVTAPGAPGTATMQALYTNGANAPMPAGINITFYSTPGWTAPVPPFPATAVGVAPTNALGIATLVIPSGAPGTLNEGGAADLAAGVFSNVVQYEDQ